MDPVANINEQRELASQVTDLLDRCTHDDGTLANGVTQEVAGMADRLAELVQELDEWRRKGGFDPYSPSLAGRLHEVTEAAQVVCHADREFRESIPFQPREVAWQVFREHLAGPLDTLRALLPGT